MGVRALCRGKRPSVRRDHGEDQKQVLADPRLQSPGLAGGLTEAQERAHRDLGPLTCSNVKAGFSQGASQEFRTARRRAAPAATRSSVAVSAMRTCRVAATP